MRKKKCMKTDILFSVVVPTYKSFFLKECIDSILLQSYTNFELIIVNDASPENIDEIVSSYSDERIKYYVNEKNCGAVDVVDNWNKCLEYSSGNYIICMGDDDKLLPNCLSEYAELIRKHPNLGVYHAWTEIIDEKSAFYELQSPRPEWESCMSLLWNRWNWRNRQYIGDFCFSVPVLKEIGGFIKFPLAWASDDITAVKCAQFGGVANTQTLCFQYRQNRYTISSVGKTDCKLEAVNLEKKWYVSFLKDYGKYIEDSVPDNFLDTEKKILKLVQGGLEQRFLYKQKMELIKDMTVCLWNVFFWARNFEKYNITKKTLLVSFFYAIIKRVTK